MVTYNTLYGTSRSCTLYNAKCKILMYRATREKSYLCVTIKVRRLYMAFKMLQLFSVHDGDMLGGVLNKKNVQKNAGSAF